MPYLVISTQFTASLYPTSTTLLTCVSYPKECFSHTSLSSVPSIPTRKIRCVDYYSKLHPTALGSLLKDYHSAFSTRQFYAAALLIKQNCQLNWTGKDLVSRWHHFDSSRLNPSYFSMIDLQSIRILREIACFIWDQQFGWNTVSVFILCWANLTATLRFFSGSEWNWSCRYGHPTYTSLICPSSLQATARNFPWAFLKTFFIS